MKKIIFLIVVTMMSVISYAQEAYTRQMTSTVTNIENASTVKDYQQLANDFLRIAEAQKTLWLPYYYAAFCNAKIGWLYQDDGDKIEPFAEKADVQIKRAISLLDTARQKKELSEVYVVLSMVNRAKVFINPMTYGRRYGPTASQYTHLAKSVDPDNPRALYIEGWEKFATPKMWGGDKTKAKELLLAAKQKLEANPSSGIEPHWGKKEVDDILKQLK